MGQAGPRLVAFTALLMALTSAKASGPTALFLETILQQPCSPAWTVKLQKQATAALRPCYDELAAALPQQPQLGIDETPHKEGPLKTWPGRLSLHASPYSRCALRGRRSRAGGTLERSFLGCGDLRSSQDVLVCGTPAVVLVIPNVTFKP